MPIVETMGFLFVACGAPVLLLQCVELGRAMRQGAGETPGDDTTD